MLLPVATAEASARVGLRRPEWGDQRLPDVVAYMPDRN